MLPLALEVAVAVGGVQLAEPAAVFAPPLGIPLTLRIERIQTAGAATYRFAAERSIVFTRTDTGYRAEMTLVSADSDAAGPGAGFDKAMTALRGVAIRMMLDRRGEVQSIDDLDTHWASLVAAIAGQGSDRPAPPAVFEQLNALPTAQRQAMLASALDTILYPGLAGGGPQPEHDIAMRPRPPYARPTPATARYRVVVMADTLVATTTASFAVVAPGGGGATMAIDETTVVDPSTGLLQSNRETRIVELASGVREATTTSTHVSY